MAGRSADFNATEFRQSIRFAMTMAAPVDPVDQATFLFASQLVYNGSIDDQFVPFNPTSTVTQVAPTPVKVTCGVEYFDREGQPLVFGEAVPSRVEITLLDQEYRLVENAVAVVIGGEKFLYKHTEPPTGLFDVGLHTMHFKLENDL